jgi:hypothetical protein
MSLLNVDKVDPSTGTALELGTSGDTITVPTGAGLTVTDEVKTNKISPATGTAFALGDSGDTFTVPSGATIVNSGTATGFGINQTSFLPDALPIIKNGSMDVAQRGTSATGITGDEYGTCDRWKTSFTTLGTWTQTQEGLSAGAAYTTGGFRSSLKMDNTTADASPAAGDRGRIIYQMEGYDAQAFKKGTASAEAFTIAFWIKATKTGTNIVEIYDNDAGRHCCTAYTVSSTDTWEHKILNFPADTTGAIALSNAAKLTISFYLGAGTNYTSGTLATTWAAAVSANRAVGQVNNADSTSNNWEITGVQMEVGEYTSSDLPPFRFESYGDNLLRCQRYTFILKGDDGDYAGIPMQVYSATSTNGPVKFPQTMRAKPTLTMSATFSVQANNDSTTTTTAPTIYATDDFTSANLYSDAVSSMTAGQAGNWRWNADSSTLTFSSEL